MTSEVSKKSDVTLESVAAALREAGVSVPPDRLESIRQRLRELFELAAPLEEADIADVEVTQPFDPRWPGETTA
ncbi:MAG: hypothetical protein ACJ789_15495 [Thermomicrobiales bacterium]